MANTNMKSIECLCLTKSLQSAAELLQDTCELREQYVNILNNSMTFTNNETYRLIHRFKRN
jgi:hypothetical protein